MPFKIRVSAKDFIGQKIISHKVTELDDRAYVCAMASYLLQQLRREHLVTRKKPNAQDILSKLQVNPGKPLDKLFG